MAMLMKWFHRIVNLLLTLLLVCAALLVAPRVLGMESYAVISASMQRAYPVGSLIYVQKVDPVKIEVGDTISFSMGGMVATHRVFAKDTEAKTFTTKGDSNEFADGSPIAYEQVIGKVVLGVPLLGSLSQWMTPLRAGVTIGAVLLLSFLPTGKPHREDQAA